jgi:uncharacterized protein (TIGR00730 family)
MADQIPKSRPDRSETNVLSGMQSIEFEPIAPNTLVDQIKEVADKLVRDQTTHGDLKIILRALKELRYAFKVFKPFRMRRKVTMFGSARTPPDSLLFEMGVEFGRRMAEEGWMVVTGGGPGIMEAGHVGAGREMSFGLNIVLPFEQDANPIIAADEKLINFKYFFTRKLLFVKEVHGIVLFPGGFGTLDELFEALTLVQTGKRDLMPIICVDQPRGTYWSSWRNFIVDELFQDKLISPADVSLFTIVDSVEGAVRELLQFYSVYHSMRFVRRKLVLRLNREPGSDLLARLNDEFGDIMAGPLVRTDALPLESDEPHLVDLPRLVCQFNRKDIGRLRQMVDVINSTAARPATDAATGNPPSPGG